MSAEMWNRSAFAPPVASPCLTASYAADIFASGRRRPHFNQPKAEALRVRRINVVCCVSRLPLGSGKNVAGY